MRTIQKYFEINSKSFSEHGVTNHRDLWLKVKEAGFTALQCDVPVDFKKETKTNAKSGETKDVYKMIFSTDDPDRHNDIVKQEWELKWFKKNSVLLDSHNYHSIDFILGKVKKITQDPTLSGEIEFATITEKGQRAKDLVDGGFLNASSVGFIPLEFDNEGNILKSELLEISLVSVPANPRALFEKAVGEIKEEIKTIEKEITEETPIVEVAQKVQTIKSKRDILVSITRALKDIQKQDIKRQKRLLFRKLRSLK